MKLLALIDALRDMAKGSHCIDPECHFILGDIDDEESGELFLYDIRAVSFKGTTTVYFTLDIMDHPEFEQLVENRGNHESDI